MKERIQKVLAAAGVASRRQIEQMVLDGRIAVNGRTTRSLPVIVDPDIDKIDVDGQRIAVTSHEGPKLYFILNKPRGVYCTNSAQGAQLRAVDLLPDNLGARLYPVGRLDAESKGLLLLTNDGELTNLLTHPRFGITKTYRAIVDGHVQQQTLDALARGIWLTDKEGRGVKAVATHLKIVKRTREKTALDIQIREGRNLQIRRALAKLGHKVRDLTRTRIGPLTLEGLKPGHCRPLTRRELRELKERLQHTTPRPQPTEQVEEG